MKKKNPIIYNFLVIEQVQKKKKNVNHYEEKRREEKRREISIRLQIINKILHHN
jgi:hypothetical protein